MKLISLEDFERSDTAVRLGLHNAVPEMLLPTARETLAMMQRIQAYLSAEAGRDVQIFVSSGYRCAELNQAVGSSKTSETTHARWPAIGPRRCLARRTGGWLRPSRWVFWRAGLHAGGGQAAHRWRRAAGDAGLAGHQLGELHWVLLWLVGRLVAQRRLAGQ